MSEGNHGGEDEALPGIRFEIGLMRRYASVTLPMTLLDRLEEKRGELGEDHVSGVSGMKHHRG
jgi:hypothetical protein